MDLHECLFPEHFSSRGAPGGQYLLQNKNIKVRSNGSIWMFFQENVYKDMR